MAPTRRLYTDIVARLNPQQRDLVEKHVGLSYRMATRYADRDSVLSSEDLAQAGVFGLARAVQLFDESRGEKFSTYAAYWIRAFMWMEIVYFKNLIYVPKVPKVPKVNGASNKEPVDRKTLVGSLQPRSITLCIKTEDTVACGVDNRDQVDQALTGLDEEERRIVRARFFQEKTQADIASELGIEVHQVKYREAKAMKKLKGLVQEKT